jgi:hypothetical protein
MDFPLYPPFLIYSPSKSSAVPIVESMAAMVLMDALLIQASRTATANLLPPITTLPPTMVMPGMGKHHGLGSKGPSGDE